MDHNDGRGTSANGSKKRGSVRNKSRLEAFTNRSGRGNAEWGSCNADLMQDVVQGITLLGGAVIFALSRDQGAHSITLLLDDNKTTLWFNGDADLDSELQDVLATISAIS